MTAAEVQQMVRGYLACALWTGIDEYDEPLDQNFNPADFSSDAEMAAARDCQDFATEARSLLDGIDPDQAGHDFWLTRNGHGAGFWDRGLGERGDKLTEMAHAYGEAHVWVNEADMLDIE